MVDSDLQEQEFNNIMSFANLTELETLNSPGILGKFYRDRFDTLKLFLIVESPFPLCVSGTNKEDMQNKALDIIAFWQDVKNGVYDDIT
jgi:hypothetical protein